MVASFARLADLERVLGPLADDQLSSADYLLEVAEAKVRARIGDPAVRVAAGRTTDVLVRNVVVEMVVAVLRNPTGLRSTSRGEGPYTESATFDARAAAGRLAITREQLHDLGVRRGVGSVPVGDPALARPVRRPDDDIVRLYSGLTVDPSQTP